MQMERDIRSCSCLHARVGAPSDSAAFAALSSRLDHSIMGDDSVARYRCVLLV